MATLFDIEIEETIRCNNCDIILDKIIVQYESEDDFIGVEKCPHCMKSGYLQDLD